MPKRNVAWIFVIAVIGLLTWQLPTTVARRDSVYRTFGSLVDIRAQIHRRYVQKIDDQELLNGAIEGMLGKLDPFSTYISAEEYKDFQEQTQGELHGIGVEISLTNGELRIISPIDDTPAFHAGLMPGDVITGINGTRAEGMSIGDAAKLIKGAPGTSVTLTVRRAASGHEEEIAITRAAIELPKVKGWARTLDGTWDYMIDPDSKIAYIRVSSFTHKTAEQIREALEPMLAQGMRALIMDLRMNPGGLLTSAVDTADLFFSEGLVVETRGRHQRRGQHFAKPEGTLPDFPMAVLVNQYSASAAEIVAGALRDHGRAIVVGQRTFGKGSVQNIIELEGQDAAIKLTTARYYLPGGECIHRTPEAEKSGKWGVDPQVEINLTDDEVGEIWTTRRDSDILSVGPNGEPGHDAPAENQAARSTPVMDRQLTQAIIQMQQKLQERENAAATASK